jgi:hypothetical protein
MASKQSNCKGLTRATVCSHSLADMTASCLCQPKN